ncbi:MAG: ParB/RepB/Spo0J family partition protein [Patescibacteria group bacterium]
MALGRGLGALISPSGSSHQKQTTNISADGQEKIWYIPLTSITPNSHQPRRNFNDDQIKELANSIKQHGILQPILVTEKSDGGYELVAGERRWRASQIAGLASIPAVIKVLADRDKLEVALIENVHRENLDPIEEAFAYQRLVDEFGLTQQDVADKVGKSRPAVANTIRLLELPEEIKSALVERKINAGQARALLSLGDKKKQLDMLASMLGQKITVRELEHSVARQTPNKTRRDPNLLYLEEQIRLALGTKVTITAKGERGTIVIDYYSKEELARLIKRISE